MNKSIDLVSLLRFLAGNTTAIATRPALAEAADEIERLRLTGAEREAMRFAAMAALPESEKLGGVAGELCRKHAATLRGLLERHKGVGE